MYTKEELDKMTSEELFEVGNKLIGEIDEERIIRLSSPHHKEWVDSIMSLKSLRHKYN